MAGTVRLLAIVMPDWYSSRNRCFAGFLYDIHFRKLEIVQKVRTMSTCYSLIIFYTEGATPPPKLAIISIQIALRENWQGYRGVPGQNSRSASFPLILSFSLCSGSVCPGITPFLPKIVKQPSSRAVADFTVDHLRKRILYDFGFTRNNAG